jgi:hypothetical protein
VACAARSDSKTVWPGSAGAYTVDCPDKPVGRLSSTFVRSGAGAAPIKVPARVARGSTRP